MSTFEAQSPALDEAAASVTAIVRVGDQRGRQLGFPTANLHPADAEERQRGVYAAVARTQAGETWPAAVNIGTRPTFTGGAARVSVEVHLIGFDGDLYGQELSVHFVRRLRDEVAFGSLDALVAQLRTDVADAAAVVGSWDGAAHRAGRKSRRALPAR